ncbi:MAG: potassium-transporting ATPase subunit C [Firmicutes bacterium]|nr:potassium-transporting ATPase subunit C [Bacillota bacterium]
MTVPDVLGILMFTLVLIVIAKSVGLYLYAVYDTRQTWLDPLMCAVERRGTAGVKDNHEMPWTEYFLAILTFNLIGFVVLWCSIPCCAFRQCCLSTAGVCSAVITGLTQTLFPARGSLIKIHGRVIGSRLIGQSLTEQRTRFGYYTHGCLFAGSLGCPHQPYPLAVVKKLIGRHLHGRFLGMYGNSYVNALELNLSLREWLHQHHT